MSAIHLNTMQLFDSALVAENESGLKSSEDIPLIHIHKFDKV